MNEKTNVRESKDGETTIKKSLYNFPHSIHQKALEQSGNGVTVGDIYSNAISKLRKDYDSGDIDMKYPLKPEKGSGGRVQVWLTETANEDLKYLTEKLNSKEVYITYTSMIYFFE